MRICVALLAVVLSGCDSDVVSHRYSDMSHARSDGLFGKGWLPSFLPNSSVNIRTDNNVSANSSTGSFEFNSRDAAGFYSKLERGAPDSEYFENWSDTVQNFKQQGYSAWKFGEDEYIWAFFCAPSNDRCEYFLWPAHQARVATQDQPG